MSCSLVNVFRYVRCAHGHSCSSYNGLSLMISTILFPFFFIFTQCSNLRSIAWGHSLIGEASLCWWSSYGWGGRICPRTLQVAPAYCPGTCTNFIINAVSILPLVNLIENILCAVDICGRWIVQVFEDSPVS